ncbi:MAG: Lactoylglutathione lyase, partial [uncultured Rubrobacteraceae bacterium]
AIRSHLLQGSRPRQEHRFLHEQAGPGARPQDPHRRRRDQRLLRRPRRSRAPVGAYPQPRPDRAVRDRHRLQPRRLRRRGFGCPRREARSGRRGGVREQAPRHGQRHPHILRPRPRRLPHRVHRTL